MDVAERSLKSAKSRPDLNCFTRLTPEVAITQATESLGRYESGKSMGPLDGVPIAIKDNFCVENIPTTCGSK